VSALPRYTVADAEAAARLRDDGAPGGDALRVAGLTVAGPRASRPLVDGLDLVVRRGEAVGLAGERGSGAELVADAILGVLAAPLGRSGGTLALSGRPHEPRRALDALTERGLQDVRGRDVALVPPRAGDALDPTRRIDAQLTTAIRRLDRHLPRAAARARAGDLLETVGLEARERRAFPAALDVAAGQRAAIAIALAGGPSLLVCVEPGAGLDAVARAHLLDLLTRARHDLGVALLVVTADLAAIAATCHRVVVVYAGRIVEDGPTAAVLSAPAHPYTAALVRATPGLAGPQPVHGLDGRPPLPGTPPAGCAFHPRCPVRVAGCDTTVVDLRGAGPARRGRCLLLPAAGTEEAPAG
jgi:oligopeptide/dipeptide ABC transporter ATP-binding protein